MAAERNPAFHVLWFLNADRVETAKRRLDEKTKSAKARFRSLREAGVYQGERKAAAARFRGEVRPHFRFHQHDSDRPDHREGPPHDRPEIERTVENFHILAGFRCRNTEAGRGRRGEHAEELGIELTKFGR